MYPIKGGRRVKAQRIDFEWKDIKDQKLCFACTEEEKQAFIDLCIREGIVISELGHKVIKWLFEIAQKLPKNARLLDYLTDHQGVIEALQEEISAERLAKQLFEAKVARLEKDLEQLTKERAQEQKAIKAKEQRQISMEVSADVKQAFDYFCADEINKGASKNMDGVVLNLLGLATASGRSYIAKEFKLKGRFRDLVLTKKDQYGNLL